MIKRAFALLSVAAATAVSSWAQSGTSKNNDSVFQSSTNVMPTFSREMRGMWVTTVFNLDWPSNTTRTTAQQQQEAIDMLDMCAAMNVNTVCVQVRSQADSLYSSTIEPWGPMLRGTFGTAPNPLYDPLTYWITQAKARGIQVYAWINPYRALSSSTSTTPANHISKKAGYTDLYPTSATANSVWIDPSGPGAQQTKDVINDVVTRYDIDGVIFDDYFYPYPYNSVDYPDSDAYAAYQGAGGTLSKKEWRIKNVNDLVQSVNLSIKQIKPHMKFGISPFGIYRSSNGITGDGRPRMPSPVIGLNAVDELYADSLKWMQSGWIDFIAPQIYWTIGSTNQPHGTIMNWWVQQNTAGRHVYVANAASSVASGSWSVTELVNQINLARSNAGVTGNIHYRISSVQDTATLRNEFTNNTYKEPALIPAYTWIDGVPPLPPLVSLTQNTGLGTQTIAWTPFGSEAANWYTVAYLVGTTWTKRIVPATTTSILLPLKSSGKALRAFGVASVDRAGNSSTWSQRILDPTVIGTSIRD